MLENFRSNRMNLISKVEKNNNLREHIQSLKDKNIDINQYLNQMSSGSQTKKIK